MRRLVLFLAVLLSAVRISAATVEYTFEIGVGCNVEDFGTLPDNKSGNVYFGQFDIMQGVTFDSTHAVTVGFTEWFRSSDLISWGGVKLQYKGSTFKGRHNSVAAVGGITWSPKFSSRDREDADWLLQLHGGYQWTYRVGAGVSLGAEAGMMYRVAPASRGDQRPYAGAYIKSVIIFE